MKRDNIQLLLDRREVGLSSKHARLLRGHSSLQEGLRVTNVLRDHSGCVNCLEWHPSGEELLSSGDDLKIDVWSSESWALKGSYRTGHAGNVFCVKYVPCQKQSFVTAAADGDVRLTDLIKEEDRAVVRPRVEVLSATPGDMTLKIEFLPLAPMSFLTTHRDGTIRLTDLRNARRTGTAGDAPEQTVVQLSGMMFFSICFDPTSPHTFAAGCGNEFVRLYDLRMAGRPYDATPESGCVKLWTDPKLLGRGGTPMRLMRETRNHVTDVRFSSKGNLLVNFADNDLVLFAGDEADKRDGVVCTKVLQRFEGRQNKETFLKEARFLGDETHVATGGDSGELFVWHAESGELVHRVTCDRAILNGVEAHPFLPTLAVCGIDPTVKILEFRGGRGVLEQDPIKEEDQMSFRQRMLTSPEVLVEGEVAQRMAAAEEARLEGNELFRQPGRVTEAKHRYDDALHHLKFYPPNPEQRGPRDHARLKCMINLAQCYILTEEWRYAERMARLALAIDPANVKALFRLAKALEGRREPERALDALKRMRDLPLSEEEKASVAKLRAKLKGMRKH